MDNIEERILRATLALFRAGPPPNGVTADAICELANISLDQFLDSFQGAGQAIGYSYALLMDEADITAGNVPGFESMLVEERLATICFVLLDVFEQHENFVAATFANRATGFFSPFQERLRESIATLLDAPDLSGTNRVLFNNAPIRLAISESIVQVLSRWVADDSDDKERSTALIDRVVAWWSEVLTNGIADRSLDLIRYSVEAGYLPIDKLPFVRDWLNKSS